MLGDVIQNNLDYLVRFASIRVGSKSDAEDVVYEAIRRILETDLSKIRQDSIKMYLFRIVYNLCKDFFLTRENVRPLSEIDDEIPDSSKENVLDLEEIDRLNSILDNLPDKEAEIVRMSVIDELTFVEISQILSTPASTVKTRYKTGIEKLKKQYFKNK